MTSRSEAPRRALFALVGIAAAIAPASADSLQAPPSGGLEIRFFDVGQGDAVLIRAGDGRAALYDAGDGRTSLLHLLEAAGVRTLELVIASHNHADHIGGLPEVIERYKPRFVMENGIPHTTRAYENLLRAMASAGAQRLEPTRRTIQLGDIMLHVLPPPGTKSWGQNDNSIGLIVEYAGFRASLLGDSEQRLQEWWLDNHKDRLAPVDVHKASHHGSVNGDVLALVEQLRPAIVIVSIGAGNRYGHPHVTALRLYDRVGAHIHRTDRNGTILVRVEPDGEVHVRQSHPQH